MFALGLVRFVPLVDVAEVLHLLLPALLFLIVRQLECLRRADRQDDHRHPDQRRLSHASLPSPGRDGRELA
jgi:hypothetical protein